MYIFDDSKFRLKVNMYGGQGSGGGIGGSERGFGGFGGLGIGNPGSYGGGQTVGAPGFSGGYNGGTGNQGRDPLQGWDFWDRFAAGSTVGLPLGPVGSLLAGTMAGVTSFADPGGSVAAPLGSVSGGNSETSRQIAAALAAPIAPSLAPAPAAPVAPIAPSLGPSIGTADIKRKRIGRQETILTSRSSLSNTSTAQPTLLGQ